MSIFFQFKKWVKGLFFKNQKQEPEPPIQFQGLIKRIDEAQQNLEVQIQDNKEFQNSSAIEGLFGDVIVPVQDTQAEIREMEFFARRNNIQEDFWDEPRVYKAGEIIDEESQLRAVKTDMDNAVFGDDVEMVSDRMPKATFAKTTAHFMDNLKPKEEPFDPNKFVFKKPEDITKEELIQYLKGHSVPFGEHKNFLRFGSMFSTTGGWSQWIWHSGLFENATEDTLYEVYLQLRVVEHKQDTENFHQDKLTDQCQQ